MIDLYATDDKVTWVRVAASMEFNELQVKGLNRKLTTYIKFLELFSANFDGDCPVYLLKAELKALADL